MRPIRTPALRTLALVPLLVIGMTGCARLPQAQMEEARAELSAAAKSADVLTYAPDPLRAAQETMGALEQELAAQAGRLFLVRSYDTSSQLALQVLAESRTAVKAAGDAKKQVRAETGPLIAATAEAAAAVEKKLWAARRVRGVRTEFLAQGAADIAQARASLADAQGDYDAGAFASARAKAMAVRDGLAGLEARISEAVLLARR
jgi:hypothetical protein